MRKYTFFVISLYLGVYSLFNIISTAYLHKIHHLKKLFTFFEFFEFFKTNFSFIFKIS